MTENSRARLDQCVDTIESGYEYFLAYAAQGRRTDRDTGAATSEVRSHLEKMIAAMDELDSVVRDCAGTAATDVLESSGAFFDAVAEDAAKAAGALRLTLARSDISSQLIDNLNASIHVRALLTDLFIIDEALR
ncbi:MAG: hypothetical protein PVF50_04740 [Gammaproteobacteria bacterium]|jgi:hypothetical protein